MTLHARLGSKPYAITINEGVEIVEPVLFIPSAITREQIVARDAYAIADAMLVARKAVQS